MTTLTSKNEKALMITRAYIRWIQSLYADGTDDGGEKLILVLKIYEVHLARYPSRMAATFDQLMTMKHGVRQAELLLVDLGSNEAEMMTGWYGGCNAQNAAHRLANVLWEIIMELTKEIDANERLYPELKPAFDRERAEYREMLEAAKEE